MVLGVKGSEGLEVIRKYVEQDFVFAAIDNRPLDDLEQRDLDLDRIHKPSRGMHVDQTSTPSDQVVVDAGTWCVDGTTVNQYAGATLAAITPPAAGRIRIDIVWFNAATAAVTVTAGTGASEGAVGGGFAALTRPDVPANSGAVPLAYLYVGEATGVTIPFDRTIAINTSGHIEDIRLMPGIASPLGLLETVVGNFQADGAAALGTQDRLCRSDHVHPANVAGALPATLSVGAAGTAGASNIYARADHNHPVPAATSGGTFQSDVVGGAAGSSALFARADHRHVANIDATAAADVRDGFTGSAAGSSTVYARRDHIHGGIRTWFDHHLFPASSAVAWTTGAIPFKPLFAIAIFALDTNRLGWNGLHFGVGFYTAENEVIPGGGVGSAAAATAQDTTGTNNLGTTVFETGFGIIAGWISHGFGDGVGSFGTEFRVTSWPAAAGGTITVTPNNALAGAATRVGLLVFGY